MQQELCLIPSPDYNATSLKETYELGNEPTMIVVASYYNVIQCMPDDHYNLAIDLHVI